MAKPIPITPLMSGKMPTGKNRVQVFRAFLAHKMQQRLFNKKITK